MNNGHRFIAHDSDAAGGVTFGQAEAGGQT